MPARKAPTPGIGRPLGELRALTEATNAKLDLMIEAQTKMVEALTGLLVKIANGAVQKTLERMTDDTAVFTSQPYFGPPAPRDATNPAVPTHWADPAAEIEPVPRGTFPDIQSRLHLADLAPAPLVDDGTHIDIPMSYDADMAAELAEYAAQDDELPEQDDDDLWSRRLSLHRAMRMWKPEWGAMPGQAGCQVPPHLLNGRG